MRQIVRANALGLILAIVYSALLPYASAQLIGNRAIGSSAQSLTQQRAGAANASPGSTIGAASGLQSPNARYMRGNRSRQDFVGSNRTDLSGFVGSRQAIGVGRVPSATENLKIEATKADRINRPLPPQPAKGMYYPRLIFDSSDDEIASELPNVQPASVAATQRIAEFSNGRVNVTMEGTTAVLRGTVASKREAALLAQLLAFEPGNRSGKNRNCDPKWHRLLACVSGFHRLEAYSTNQHDS